MHGDSPSAAASPATRATSVSWTSAGSTVAMGAPVLPPPPVRPSVLLPGLLPVPGPPAPPASRLHSDKSPAPARPYFSPAPNPVSLSSAVCPPPRPSQPCSPAAGQGGSVGHSPAHTSSPARHAHVPVPHRLHGPQMHPAGVCGVLCQQQHLHRQPGQPAPVPMPAWLPGRPLPVP